MDFIQILTDMSRSFIFVIELLISSCIVVSPLTIIAQVRVRDGLPAGFIFSVYVKHSNMRMTIGVAHAYCSPGISFPKLSRREIQLFREIFYVV